MTSRCLQGVEWAAEPQGREDSVDTCHGNKQYYYVTGTNPDVGIMVIHDLLGWTFPNTRLLADYYAAEVGATVYVPDFFGGEVLPRALVTSGAFDALGLPSFLRRNPKTARGPEMASFARFLRGRHRRLGAIGFCYGGWGVFHVGQAMACVHSARDDSDALLPLVDCISTAHPSLLEMEEMRRVGVPVQILAPERDVAFTEELKAFALAEIPKLSVPFDYQIFPGLEHGFAVRGDPEVENEVRGMERAKRAAVAWFREWLVHGEEERTGGA
ncbi:hypothetical protein VTK26DRAFT_912 [Humicola hyalothermophila]